VYKIAIAGASTLLGRELKEALEESPLAAASFVLLDEEASQGQLDQVGDEVKPSAKMPLTAWTLHSFVARRP
jgi:aspartate-semialdehyde dehydrogenase